MSVTKTVIEVRRHAQPLIDPVTLRSLDVLTQQGVQDSIHLGSTYASHQGDLILYHSGMLRALQTAANICVGAGKVAKMFEAQPGPLGLDFFTQAKDKPTGIPYGPEFIHYLVEKNPGLQEKVAWELKFFIQFAYQEHQPRSNPLIVGISHGPKVEIGYGALVGTADYGSLAAQPLDGFTLEIDRVGDSIDQVKIGYKNQPLEKIAREKVFD